MQRWSFKLSFQIPQSLCLFFCKFNCCWKSHFLFIAPLITTTHCSHLLQQHLVSISASHHNGVCCQGKTMKTWKMQIVCKTNMMYLPVSNRIVIRVIDTMPGATIKLQQINRIATGVSTVCMDLLNYKTYIMPRIKKWVFLTTQTWDVLAPQGGKGNQSNLSSALRQKKNLHTHSKIAILKTGFEKVVVKCVFLGIVMVVMFVHHFDLDHDPTSLLIAVFQFR